MVWATNADPQRVCGTVTLYEKHGICGTPEDAIYRRMALSSSRETG